MPANDNSVGRTLHDLGLAAWFGGSLMRASGLNGVPVEGGTSPHHPTTPADAARPQRRLTALPGAIPVLTGAMLVVSARMGEQQRPTQVTGGLIRRFLPGR